MKNKYLLTPSISLFLALLFYFFVLNSPERQIRKTVAEYWECFDHNQFNESVELFTYGSEYYGILLWGFHFQNLELQSSFLEGLLFLWHLVAFGSGFLRFFFVAEHWLPYPQSLFRRHKLGAHKENCAAGCVRVADYKYSGLHLKYFRMLLFCLHLQKTGSINSTFEVYLNKAFTQN